jgi:hypothetical protein
MEAPGRLDPRQAGPRNHPVAVAGPERVPDVLADTYRDCFADAKLVLSADPVARAISDTRRCARC